MERMLVVVFDTESKAYEGVRALNQVEAEGNIAIYAESVIKKNADGTVTVKESEDGFPIRTLGGTAIGSLIGLLGGPVGLGIGTAAGLLAGSIGDLNVAGVAEEFLGDVAAALTPGKCAVIADVSEEWITPVDTRMEALGATVHRAAKENVEADQRARDVAALRTDIEQLKAEHAHARADRKAKLQAKIDQLNAKLQAKLDQAEQRSKEFKSETDAKVQALRNKAEKAQGEVKARLEARAKRIREDYEHSTAKLKHAMATQFREAAAGLEK